MKSTSPFLILLLLLTIATPGSAQKYHDALLNELKGPVKSMEDWIYSLEYDSNGALISLTEEEYPIFVRSERNAQGYVTALYRYYDEACTDPDYSTHYTYNSKGQIISDSKILDGNKDIVYYTYNADGLVSQYQLYSNGKHIRTVDYEYESVDNRGNWISRWAESSDSDDSYYEIRNIIYWETPAPASAPVPKATPKATPAPTPQTMPTPQTGMQPAASNSGWKKYIGKQLDLTLYGISKNKKEAGQTLCTSGEYIKLGSDGILYWGNRHDGDASYRYRIDGNRIYLTLLSGKATGDQWLEMTWDEIYGQIKTESNTGTYRYFCINE